jgi:hypothetical protein
MTAVEFKYDAFSVKTALAVNGTERARVVSVKAGKPCFASDIWRLKKRDRDHRITKAHAACAATHKITLTAGNRPHG